MFIKRSIRIVILMKYTIFYSWQSDLPNNTNRGFIESVIEKSIKNFNESDNYELEPSIDRDTKNVPGSPNITQALIEKIKKSDAFVADISIVTGDKHKAQRLSPNPNVMLELGYAIALLGWDRIILFCNEVYGTDEDLPFDIRQHRQIKYSLKQDDTKSECRNNLSKHFGKKLIELIKHGKLNSSDIKTPLISTKWSFGEQNGEPSDNVTSQTITLEKSTQPQPLTKLVEEDIEKIKKTDGDFDPEWNKKRIKYLQEAEKFLEERSHVEITKSDVFFNNLNKAKRVTLYVENIGNLKATDIRIEINLPQWIIAFEEYPVKNFIPELPTPKVPKRKSFMEGISLDFLELPNIHALDVSTVNATSACYLKDNMVKFWADSLLHKHNIRKEKNEFYLLAAPDAPVGISQITANVFCSEIDDWQEIILSININ